MKNSDVSGERKYLTAFVCTIAFLSKYSRGAEPTNLCFPELLTWRIVLCCSYGDEEESGSERVRWRRVEHCSSVTQSQCDVSQETFNLEEDYYTRVRPPAQTHSPSGPRAWAASAPRSTVSALPADDVLPARKYSKHCTLIELQQLVTGAEPSKRHLCTFFTPEWCIVIPYSSNM